MLWVSRPTIRYDTIEEFNGRVGYPIATALSIMISYTTVIGDNNYHTQILKEMKYY